MNYDKLIEEVNARASSLFLKRQALQKTLQELQQEIMQTEVEMIKTDGEIQAYQKMMKLNSVEPAELNNG